MDMRIATDAAKKIVYEEERYQRSWEVNRIGLDTGCRPHPDMLELARCFLSLLPTPSEEK